MSIKNYKQLAERWTYRMLEPTQFVILFKQSMYSNVVLNVYCGQHKGDDEIQQTGHQIFVDPHYGTFFFIVWQNTLFGVLQHLGFNRCAQLIPILKMFKHFSNYFFLISYVCWCCSCEICGKRFSQKTVLQSHATVHSEERPHPCTQCGKSFKQFSSLYIHSKLHLPDQAKFKFSCSYCPKKWVHYLIVQSMNTRFYFIQNELSYLLLFGSLETIQHLINWQRYCLTNIWGVSGKYRFAKKGYSKEVIRHRRTSL